MRKDRWRNPKMPLWMLALKLAEEAAEIGTEISDEYIGNLERGDRPSTRVSAERRAAILAELDQVDFISSILRDRLTA